MNIYIICAVRHAVVHRLNLLRDYAERLRKTGHTVHFPPDDAPQDDPTGAEICATHRRAMLQANEVHVFWNADSFGSHFDLGMAYALRKKIVPIQCELIDAPGKSYWKMIQELDSL